MRLPLVWWLQWEVPTFNHPTRGGGESTGLTMIDSRQLLRVYRHVDYGAGQCGREKKH